MTVLKNRAGVSTSTTGTGTITLGVAIGGGVAINTVGWQTFAGAGVADGNSVRYLIFDSNGTWEYGPGTYTSSGTTLSRAVGSMNGSVAGQRSSSGSLLSLTGTAQVFITALEEDILTPETAATTYLTITTAASTYAPLASPVFTGNPTGPTASPGDSDTSLATTAFVAAAITAGGFPSGTLMLFQQTNAPTGWTKQTTHNDKTLRVVSGTASSGGTSAFSTVFGKTATDGTTLTSATMPVHTHAYTDPTHSHTTAFLASSQAVGGLGENAASVQFGGSVDASGVGITIQNTGSSGSHTHPMDIRVQYVDLIIASKN